MDEIEAGSKICRRFRRGSKKEFGVKRGIVNVYMSAGNSLRLSLNLGIVAVGTGTSYETLKAIKSDIGKQKGGVYVTGDFFPLANKEVINTLLSKLKTDVHLDEQDLSFPLNHDFDLKSANSCIEVISNYCVGARFRLFCGALEHIKGCTEEDNPLLAALKQSVILHQSRLRQLLLERLPQHVPIADNVIIVSETYWFVALFTQCILRG